MGLRTGAARLRPDADRTCHLPRRRRSTSDDPSAYRSRREAAAWPLGDPIERLKKHLITIGEWSEERHKQAEAEVLDEVVSTQKQAEAIGTLGGGKAPSPRDMFEGVYETMPPHLIRQRQQAGY